MRTRTLNKRDAQRIDISRFPNFHRTGSISGMKKLYYGRNALLVRCGSWIYNVSSEPEIYAPIYFIVPTIVYNDWLRFNVLAAVYILSI